MKNQILQIGKKKSRLSVLLSSVPAKQSTVCIINCFRVELWQYVGNVVHINKIIKKGGIKSEQYIPFFIMTPENCCSSRSYTIGLS